MLCLAVEPPNLREWRAINVVNDRGGAAEVHVGTGGGAAVLSLRRKIQWSWRHILPSSGSCAILIFIIATPRQWIMPYLP